MKNITIQKHSSNYVLNLNTSNICTKKMLSISDWSIFTTLLFTMLALGTFKIQAQWVNVGIPGFSPGQASFISLAINGSTPYVAFENNANGGKAMVMKYDGSNWLNVGIPGFSIAAANYLSLAFYGSTPYVAYDDFGLGHKTTVMKYDGTNWINVGTPGFSDGNSDFQSLALNGSTPYVAFQDVADGSTLTVMKYDGTSWVYVGTRGFSAGFAGSPSLAIYGSTPYVAFQDEGTGFKTTVMKFDGTDWVNVGTPGFSAGYATHQSLAIGGSIPYVAFEDDANGFKTTVMKFDGTNWVNVGTPGFSAGYATNQSLALNGSTPYVAYDDGAYDGRATVMKFDFVLPVELSSFTSIVSQSKVTLNWTTTSETNNSGFKVERLVSGSGSIVNNEWSIVNFVNGNGNTNTLQNYYYEDRNLLSGKYKYRLKQIDFNGNFQYYELQNEVIIEIPEKFSLSQNYPNPFNPVTKINYDISIDGNITLKIYDNTGREVKTIVNEFKSAGSYTIEFNANNLSSGIYFYRLESSNQVDSKRMILLK